MRNLEKIYLTEEEKKAVFSSDKLSKCPEYLSEAMKKQLRDWTPNKLYSTSVEYILEGKNGIRPWQLVAHRRTRKGPKFNGSFSSNKGGSNYWEVSLFEVRGWRTGTDPYPSCTPYMEWSVKRLTRLRYRDDSIFEIPAEVEKKKDLAEVEAAVKKFYNV